MPKSAIGSWVQQLPRMQHSREDRGHLIPFWHPYYRENWQAFGWDKFQNLKNVKFTIINLIWLVLFPSNNMELISGSELNDNHIVQRFRKKGMWESACFPLLALIIILPWQGFKTSGEKCSAAKMRMTEAMKKIQPRSKVPPLPEEQEQQEVWKHEVVPPFGWKLYF